MAGALAAAARPLDSAALGVAAQDEVETATG